MSKAVFPLILVAAVVLVPAARADQYILNYSQSNGSGPFGTVDLTQINPDTVKVALTLTPGDVFAVTGAGAGALGFSVNEAFSLVSGSLTTGFTFDPAAGNPQPGSLPYTFSSGIGTYGSVIDCTICGAGTSPPNESALSFEAFNASGLTFGNFVNGSGGYLFASDLGVPDGNGGFNTFAAAGGPTTSTPEPGTASMLLLSMGLGLGMFGLRRKQALVN